MKKMEYNPNSFFDDMLECFNRLDNTRLTRDERIAGVLDAYSILQHMNSKWTEINEADRGKAVYYWRVFVRPEAERYGILLDGGEPEYIRKKSSVATRERKL